MTTNPSQVIVKEGERACGAVHTTHVNHRDYPEIWAEAGSVAEGLAHLAHKLSRARDGAASAWRRESIDRAIAEVAEFRETAAETVPDGVPS